MLELLPSADDVVLLAPCLSSLRLMLGLCEKYAVSHGLSFNPLKTQLIQFRWYSHLDQGEPNCDFLWSYTSIAG